MKRLNAMLLIILLNILIQGCNSKETAIELSKKIVIHEVMPEEKWEWSEIILNGNIQHIVSDINNDIFVLVWNALAKSSELSKYSGDNINNIGNYDVNTKNWEIITKEYPNHNFELIDFLLLETETKEEIEKKI